VALCDRYNEIERMLTGLFDPPSGKGKPQTSRELVATKRLATDERLETPY